MFYLFFSAETFTRICPSASGWQDPAPYGLCFRDESIDTQPRGYTNASREQLEVRTIMGVARYVQVHGVDIFGSLFQRFVITKVRLKLEGSLFRRSVIPKVHYSEGPLFQGSCFRMFVVPKIHYPKCPLFRRFVISKSRYSESPFLRRFVIPKIRNSGSHLFQRSIIPKVCYSKDSLSRMSVFAKVHISEDSLFRSPLFQRSIILMVGYSMQGLLFRRSIFPKVRDFKCSLF